jgi:hypothetical protein
MYSRNDFVERFRQLDDGVLLERLAHQELTSEAKEALLQVLQERGVHRDTIDRSLANAKRVRNQPHAATGCDYCGTSLRGGYISSESGQRFCSDRCRESLYFIEAAGDIPHDKIMDATHALWKGRCMRCRLKGSKVDFRTHYWVHSMVFFTAWGSKVDMCCRGCGIKKNVQGMAYSLLLGWWGMPFGLFITPIQVTRNIRQMFRRDLQPSAQLQGVARLQVAKQIVRGRVPALSSMAETKSPS